MLPTQAFHRHSLLGGVKLHLSLHSFRTHAAISSPDGAGRRAQDAELHLPLRGTLQCHFTAAWLSTLLRDSPPLAGASWGLSPPRTPSGGHSGTPRLPLHVLLHVTLFSAGERCPLATDRCPARASRLPSCWLQHSGNTRPRSESWGAEGRNGDRRFLAGKRRSPCQYFLPAKSVACPSSSGGPWLRACALCSKKLRAEPLLPWGARGRDLEPPGDVMETHPCFLWAGRAAWPWLCFSALLWVPGCRACACNAGLSRAGSRRAGRPPLLPPPGISRSVTSE